MHNLKVNFDKFHDLCQEFGSEFTNALGNIPRRGVVPKLSDLEVVALSLTMEALSIDSESLLFAKLRAEYAADFPRLISRRQFNERRKRLCELTRRIRLKMAARLDEAEDVFCVDSCPVKVCRLARHRRNRVGKRGQNAPEQAPALGYCASQRDFYYGYKLHAVCSARGVIRSFDMTPANVHDIHYLQDLKHEMAECTLIGDKGYISKAVQLDLFLTAHIRLEVPMRANQKGYKPQFQPFKRVRKRAETFFSQLHDQFLLMRNYAKDVKGLFARILAKITAATALQYLNMLNDRPLTQLKYALI